ncbi:MAG TPA: LarC family nickel insertion protein, partial [Ktedonobacterales bacterium]|nr:LarC family nickel insertion protein [Ktedonobacterales bacterium]
MLAYVDCFSGVSGDMLLGALLHAGVALDDLRAGLARLPLAGYTLEADAVSEHGIRGVRARVRQTQTEHAHRRLADVSAIIAAGGLPQRAEQRALAIFRRLAEAEGAVHGVTPEEITFHEVGAVDSIVDTVGVALGLELLGVDDLYCSELPLTSGRVRAAHGALPVPAPATLELL